MLKLTPARAHLRGHTYEGTPNNRLSGGVLGPGLGWKGPEHLLLEAALRGQGEGRAGGARRGALQRSQASEVLRDVLTESGLGPDLKMYFER